MKTAKISDMKGGWYIGGFFPTCHQTFDCEVAYKQYKIGDRERRHVHKVAKELTLITQGRVEMNGQVFRTGDIIILEPNESTDFIALEDSSTVVVKTPCVLGDKYLVD